MKAIVVKPSHSSDVELIARPFLKQFKLERNSLQAKVVVKVIPILDDIYSKEIIFQHECNEQNNSSEALETLRKIKVHAKKLKDAICNAPDLAFWALTGVINVANERLIDLAQGAPCDAPEQDPNEGSSFPLEVELEALESAAKVAITQIIEMRKRIGRGGRPNKAAERIGSPELFLMLVASAIAAALGLTPVEDAGYSLANCAYQFHQGDDDYVNEWARNDRTTLGDLWKFAGPLVEPLYVILLNKTLDVDCRVDEFTAYVENLRDNELWRRLVYEPHKVTRGLLEDGDQETRARR